MSLSIALQGLTDDELITQFELASNRLESKPTDATLILTTAILSELQNRDFESQIIEGAK